MSKVFPGFITLPDNVSELNDYMCGPMNREGLICSECIEGFGIPMISFRAICSNCNESGWYYGVIFYTFLGIIPITVLYVVVLLFQIDLTAAPFTAFVFISQIISVGFSANISLFLTNSSPIINKFLILVVTFYAFWDFNFFFHIIPPFCVSPDLKTIHVVLLNYLAFAFYPLFLICITWICINLYDRNFKPFVWSWNKLNKCIKPLNKDSKSRLLKVFCTFLVLSYQKFVALFVFTVATDNILSMNSTHPAQAVLRVDPSIKWLSTENLMYLPVSLIMLLVFVIPPIVVLALYPTRPFRALCLKCLYGGQVRAALNIFVDKFYSSYRSGLDGGRDMRAFASVYFLLRIIVYLVGISEHRILYGILLIVGTASVIATIRPYKKNYMNVIDTLLLTNLTFCLLLVDLYAQSRFGSSTATVHALCLGLVVSVPMWGFLGYISYKIIPFKKLIAFLRQRFPSCRANRVEGPDLPDRILNPELYNFAKATEETNPQAKLQVRTQNPDLQDTRTLDYERCT